jgi:hypothetical protein
MPKHNAAGESIPAGIIPDFFHDIIGYIVPGYMALVLFMCNRYFFGLEEYPSTKDVNLQVFSLSLVVAYVIGRFLEQVGLETIHRRKFPFICNSCKMPSPKWSLIFTSDNPKYTESFKANVRAKIAKWLAQQDGKALLAECEKTKKDDYFNLIQFYLRERFPSVALYEKKQNATIVLTRSLAILFFINILIYFALPLNTNKWGHVAFSLPATCWLLGNMLFSFIFYRRFRQDSSYHAEYIFETFIAMKKLLKTKGEKEDHTGAGDELPNSGP